MTTTISNTLYASRDAIRAQVIEFLQQYMELNDVDLTQSSFLSYIIDIFTTLSSNLMFYQSNIYNEFFLTQAQLPESVHNLSSFIGYSPKEASYAIANVLLTINLPFNDGDAIFNIANGFEFKTGDGRIFVTYYDTTVTVTDNTSVIITAEQDGKLFNVPVSIDTTSDDSYFQFLLPTRQYKISEQEFTIDEDLQLYQFTDINVPIEGKVASMKVYVRDPDSIEGDTGRLYERFNSLYLMNNSDYGYVLRVSPEGRRIYFGNGIIGQQPLPGSTVVVTINETDGSDGNVIAGSITTGARIYTQQSGATEIVNYSVVNPSPAYNGSDEETLQEIRDNSIKSLVSLGRLVSEQDYKNFDVVIPDAPVATNSIPVLKRSDLKVNEIQLYTILNFGGSIVPTRNAFTDKYYDVSDVEYEISSSTTYIPRDVIIKIDGIDYITLFEMTIDAINEATYYHYIMRDIQLVPTLIQSWSYDDQDLYHFHINNLKISANDSTASNALFELSYYSNEVDFANCTCEMKIVSSSDTFTMTNDPETAGGKFTYEFPDYLDIPKGSQTYYFKISNPTLVHPILVEYSAEFVFRQDLKSYMLSNTFDDGTSMIIYDIPVVLNSYYQSISKVDFETQVLQTFLNSAEFKSYRMLTDFINIKLCNTTGLSTNMLKNDPTTLAIEDIGLTSIPSTPDLGSRYIVSGNEGGTWDGHRDEVAICVDSTAMIWTFIEPKASDIAFVHGISGIPGRQDREPGNYIYTNFGWKPPIYNIPLKISLEVFKINDSSIQETTLIDNVRSAIYDYYKADFGPSLVIRQSKIIDLVHNVSGVNHCRLLKPESNIFFDFDIDNFDQQELLEYTPEYMHFVKNDITIKIFTLD
jgi:hypothetical protein